MASSIRWQTSSCSSSLPMTHASTLLSCFSDMNSVLSTAAMENSETVCLKVARLIPRVLIMVMPDTPDSIIAASSCSR